VDKTKDELIGIVGAESVLDHPDILEAYSQDQSFATPLKPWFVVRPQDSDQVQALVKWANASETPLIPVSSGPPHFNGDTVPSLAGAVIVDLNRMKAIKRIDRRNKIVVLEPGVTYSELLPALAGQGLRIAQPLLPRANKSVVASLLEREPTLIPRLNFSLPEPLRTCGVVWGTGELAFTGEAGMAPLSLEAQWKMGLAQVHPGGPLATDFVRLLTGAQGCMGIVVWASVKCELLPSVHKYRFVPAARMEDLIDFCYKLARIRLGDEMLLVNRAQLTNMLGTPAGDLKVPERNLPPWVVVVGLAGAALYPEERVEVQEKELRSLAQEFALPVLNGLPGVTNAGVVNTVGAISSDPYWKLKRKGASQGIFFLTTLDQAPKYIQTMHSVAEAFSYPASEIAIYIQPQHHGVSQHIEFTLPYDPLNKKEAARVKDIYTKASEALIAQGAYFSRPYGVWADLVYRKDATATRVLRTVKQIVDPKNVLNPGKLCF
jgi:FAD/FMN-containing dehydrogenase